MIRCVLFLLVMSHPGYALEIQSATIGKVKVTIVSSDETKDSITVLTKDSLAATRKAKRYMILNGGYFDEDGKTLGFVSRNGERLGTDWISKDPYSGFFAIHEKKASIGSAKKHPEIGKNGLIYQSGPLIIESAGVSGIKANASIHRRSIIAITSGRVEFMVTDPIGLKDLADWLLERKCEAAINLDGGPSCYLEVTDGNATKNIGKEIKTPLCFVVTE